MGFYAASDLQIYHSFLNTVISYKSYSFFFQTLFTKQEGNKCNTLRPCPLVMDNDTLASTCVYECPCDQNGCEVTYFDSQLDYEDRAGDACALQIEGQE